MIEQFGELFLDAAIKESEKVFANFGIKVATCVASAVATRLTIDALDKDSTPIQQLPENEREAASWGRTIRNAVIGASYSMAGGVAYEMIKYPEFNTESNESNNVV